MKEPLRFAVYDIGSNSVKFLVAEARAAGQPPLVLAEESHTTRLAEDLIATCELKQEAIDRTLASLKEMAGKAARLGVPPNAPGSVHSRAVATSAVRDSRNRKAFLKEAAVALGFPVTLLSGEEEAEGVYRGIRSGGHRTTFEEGDLLAVDVGGGSAEWILGAGGKIARRVSLPLGCVRLRERFIPGYPVPQGALDAMAQSLEEQLAPILADYARERRDRPVVGTGGTITAAAAIALKLPDYDPSKVHLHVLTRETIACELNRFAALDADSLRHVTGLPPKRADILVPGLAVFLATLKLLEASRLTVSVRGLRYGVLDGLIAEAAPASSATEGK
ncbi:Ppx/GppA phosphatase [Verrucomicrobium sp. GAS474]|uniref:Ppx/GppA phosphatase family protein n=1 Tax=Verrucomicrobium sp. GAS474 TaxID=1882831 RepID=UPI00087DDFAB|nr:hypothetical protein [Verrucomicrobium sp. GAS474]SDT99208.1 Ppx/GppA phosphatase [Verrucomicrobium sp. GAS474]